MITDAVVPLNDDEMNLFSSARFVTTEIVTRCGAHRSQIVQSKSSDAVVRGLCRARALLGHGLGGLRAPRVDSAQCPAQRGGAAYGGGDRQQRYLARGAHLFSELIFVACRQSNLKKSVRMTCRALSMPAARLASLTVAGRI